MRACSRSAIATVGFASLVLGMVVAAGSLPGCGVAARQKPAIVADYHGLGDKSLAIVVFTAQANTDEFPGARKDITSFVANQFRLHMPTTRLLNPDDVMSWQDDTINWFALSPKDIGAHFSVDRVLYIEVLTYEARSDQSYGDMQGQLRANCKIYDSEEGGKGGDMPTWSGVIDTKWPQDRPATGGASGQVNEITVRSRTLAAFAADLVGHFYDRPDPDVPLHNR